MADIYFKMFSSSLFIFIYLFIYLFIFIFIFYFVILLFSPPPSVPDIPHDPNPLSAFTVFLVTSRSRGRHIHSCITKPARVLFYVL